MPIAKTDSAQTRTAAIIAGTPLAALILLVLVLAFTGGYSRATNILLLVLRPITVICLVAMLLTGRWDFRAVRAPAVLLALFALTIVIQLIPLPPAWWHALPGRELPLAVMTELGGAHLWHPITLSPDATLNSALSLLPPAAILIGFAMIDDSWRHRALIAILAIVGFSMVLGLAQFASGVGSPLYWYNVKARHEMVGLFTNRNHQGALLAVAIVLVHAWAVFPHKKVRRERIPIAILAGLLIAVYALVLGSRAGLILTAGAIAATFTMHLLVHGQTLSRRQLSWLLAGAGIVALGAVAIVLGADRAESFNRLFNQTSFETEGRLRAIPTMMQMVHDHMPWGTGFGSFVPMFFMYEPDALLKPTYFNNAHNDLIELAITGGVPALAVLAAFLLWWGYASYRAFFSPVQNPRWAVLKRAASLSILILLLASLSDYPLRAPLMAAIFTLLCCWLAYPAKSES